MNGYVWLKKELNVLFDYGAVIRVIGRSVLGRKLYAITIGNGKNVVLLQYGIHAREYVTCTLAILHAKMLLQKHSPDITYVLVPMANPDGTELAQNGFSALKVRCMELFRSFSEVDFCLWKANARGVDLNNNFDAMHGKNKNASVPSSHGFPGKYPNSEPETRALVRLVENIHPKLTISFHTKGQELYYDFFQSAPKLAKDKKIAKELARSFGCKIRSVQDVSSGGFKDWCIMRHGITSLTVELGKDKLSHPICCENAMKFLKRTKHLDKLCTKAMKIIQKTSAT